MEGSKFNKYEDCPKCGYHTLNGLIPNYKAATYTSTGVGEKYKTVRFAIIQTFGTVVLPKAKQFFIRQQLLWWRFILLQAGMTAEVGWQQAEAGRQNLSRHMFTYEAPARLQVQYQSAAMMPYTSKLI